MTSGAAITTTGCGLPVEVVSAVRERVGNDFIIIYRLSMLDLVEGGGTLPKR